MDVFCTGRQSTSSLTEKEIKLSHKAAEEFTEVEQNAIAKNQGCGFTAS